MLSDDNLLKSDQWLDRSGPEEHIVVSSRARYARNLPQVPFPMRARGEELHQVIERVEAAVQQNPLFEGGSRYMLSEIRSLERNFLKENHLISVEMEKGGENRAIILSREVTLAIMVNEEDHLRMFAVEGGFQPYEVLNRLINLETELNRELHFAFSPKYGYLTACPTNTGTGLRASVMLHLPALAMTKKLPELMKSMPQFGLTVRGFYGENSENMGDFFQISNEVTLGKNEQEIVDTLTHVVEQIIQREEQMRRTLFDQNRMTIEDELWRAYGTLTSARIMSSQEAVQLLSKLRFGIDRGYFGKLTHNQLNKLIIEIQPGHLQFTGGGGNVAVDARDAMRAELLRRRLERNASQN